MKFLAVRPESHVIAATGSCPEPKCVRIDTIAQVWLLRSIVTCACLLACLTARAWVFEWLLYFNLAKWFVFLMTSTSTDRIVYVFMGCFFPTEMEKKMKEKNWSATAATVAAAVDAVARVKHRKFNNNFRLNGHCCAICLFVYFVCFERFRLALFALLLLRFVPTKFHYKLNVK